MHIAIVDDVLSHRQETRVLLEKYFFKKHIEIHCKEFESGEKFLTAAPKNNFDLIFLDIYMGGIDGMNTARQMIAQRSGGQIIFLTSSHGYAVESYEVRAAYYLTKPLSSTKLETALDQILKDRLAEKALLKASVNQVETTMLLQAILYVDCLQNCTRIHFAGSVLRVDDNVKEIIDQLISDTRFAVCDQELVVNMEWVEDISDKDFVLKNAERVPIRQRSKEELKKRFLEFALARLRQEAAV